MKILVISEDDGYGGYDYEDYCSDKNVKMVLSSSMDFKIEELKKEYRAIKKAEWKAMSKKERKERHANPMSWYISSAELKEVFAEWLIKEKGFVKIEAFEEICY